MANRANVAYIEAMEPQRTAIAAEEIRRVSRLFRSAVSTTTGLPRKVKWTGAAADMYRNSLADSIYLADSLHCAFEVVEDAMDSYASAQRDAKQFVEEGLAHAQELHWILYELMPLGLAYKDGYYAKHPDPFVTWPEWRDSYTHAWVTLSPYNGSYIEEAKRRGAETHYAAGTALYQKAIDVEVKAREVAISMLRFGLTALPEVKPGKASTALIVTGIPELTKEVEQASADPNARRPGETFLRLYQVQNNLDKATTDHLATISTPKWEIDPFSYGWTETQRSAISDMAQKRFPQTRRDLPGAPPGDGYTLETTIQIPHGHYAAFTRILWAAQVTREIGAERAATFFDLHESQPANRAAEESMDLYNAQLGIELAKSPQFQSASLADMADHVEKMVKEGKAVVLDAKGRPAFSDQVPLDKTGVPLTEATLPGRPIRR